MGLYSVRDAIRFVAGGVVAIILALIASMAMSFILSFVPASFAAFVFLVLAGVVTAVAFQFHRGPETLKLLPGVLFVLAVISLLSGNIELLSFELFTGPSMNSLFSMVASLSLLFSVVWASMEITARLLP